MSSSPANEMQVINGRDASIILKPWEMYTLGDLDYISRLPEGCLIEIRNFFNRKELFDIFFVNKRLDAVTSSRALDKHKWEGGILTIMENGFGFDLLVTCPDYPWNIDNYQYTIESSEEHGGFVEKRFTNRSAMTGSIFRHNLKIPQNFITSLKEILRHHGVRSLHFEQIYLDGNLFSILRGLLADHKVNSLNMRGVRCEDIKDEDRKSFAHFINSVGLKELNLEQSPALNGFFNARFFKDLSGSNLKYLFTDTAMQSDHSHKFHVRRSDIPSLSQYSNFISSFIVVDANWIVTMIIAYMDSLEDPLDCIGTWLLSLNGYLSDAVVDSQLVGTRYERKYGGVLRKRGTLMIARFELINRENEQLIKIRFDTTMNPQRSCL